MIDKIFNSFNTNEATLINNLDSIINYAELMKDAGMIAYGKASRTLEALE